MTPVEEIAARRVKAAALVDAFLSLARTADGEPDDPFAALELAQQADDSLWQQAEALAGVRPASDRTRGVVMNTLYDRTLPDGDPFAGFSR